MKPVDRMDRVNAYLLRLLSDIVRSELDGGNDLVTLTSVTTTRDLKDARVYVTAVAGLPGHVDTLNARAGAIRHRLKPLLDFKIIPNLRFVADDRGGNIVEVERILDSLP